MDNKPWFEGKANLSYNTQIDRWIVAVEKLSKSIEELRAAKDKFQKKISGLKSPKKLLKPSQEKVVQEPKKDAKEKESKEKKAPKNNNVVTQDKSDKDSKTSGKKVSKDKSKNKKNDKDN